MLIYLAGPMTGIVEMNYPRFFQVEELLVGMGVEVMNPARNVGPEYSDFMEQGLMQLEECECVVLLEGWEASSGALVEVERASELGISVFTLDEFIMMMGGGE